MGKTSAAVKNKYNDKNYDRIALSVPKGDKDKYKAEAEKRNMSLNEFIRFCVEKEMWYTYKTIIYFQRGLFYEMS